MGKLETTATNMVLIAYNVSEKNAFLVIFDSQHGAHHVPLLLEQCWFAIRIGFSIFKKTDIASAALTLEAIIAEKTGKQMSVSFFHSTPMKFKHLVMVITWKRQKICYYTQHTKLASEKKNISASRMNTEWREKVCWKSVQQHLWCLNIRRWNGPNYWIGISTQKRWQNLSSRTIKMEHGRKEENERRKKRAKYYKKKPFRMNDAWDARDARKDSCRPSWR